MSQDIKKLAFFHARFNKFSDYDTKDLIPLKEWCEKNHIGYHTARYWILKKNIIGYKMSHRWYVNKEQLPLPYKK